MSSPYDVVGAVPAPRPPILLAGIALPPGTLELFESCFRKFKVPVQLRYFKSPAELAGTRFDGCVLPLDERAPERLGLLRSSAVNRSALAYGIGRPEGATAVAHLGINVIIGSADEQDILRAVENTYLLLVRKLRRYVRVPIVTPVQVQIEGSSEPVMGYSKDIGAGGIAVQVAAGSKLSTRVTVRFVLPGLAPLSIPALVCWYTGDSVGMQFAASEHLNNVKIWVEQYLGVA